MLSTIIIIIIGYFAFRYYKKTKEKRVDHIYEKENPIDTRDFTFEQSVEGCCATVKRICELDEKMDKIDKTMREMQNSMGQWERLRDFRSERGYYKKNDNYPESEKNKQYRAYFRKANFLPWWFIPLFVMPPILTPIILSTTSNKWLMFILVGILVLVIVLVIVFFLIDLFKSYQVIKEERKIYPWHFNLYHPGSPMGVFQQDFCDALEETHRLYYDLYLPCKRRADNLIADNLIADSKNREGKYYNVYKDICKYDNYIQGCTPMQRLRKLKAENQRKEIRKALIITTGAVVITAVVIGLVNNAGKNLFPKYKSTDKWIDMNTGKVFDHNPTNDL